MREEEKEITDKETVICYMLYMYSEGRVFSLF